MDAAKIRLSTEERELLIRPDWILTKNRVIQKAKYLLEKIQNDQQSVLNACRDMIPEEVYNTSAKISKGENYQGLPYLILDQPRYFNKDNIFAIRTFFWWGNFFSSTLHLSGGYKYHYQEKIKNSLSLLKQHDLFICHNTDQWEHHFEEDNFIAAKSVSDAWLAGVISDRPFIKLSKKIPLEEWDNAQQLTVEIFSSYLSILGS